ncbi:hypothetical protein MRB53_003346 [Persea americana]|uniref:Uncharacterized protein n=1 Tax=Persea americana TaxID=3435 RepID=A0ACC2MXZ7_PERAE|nr:hypothetical protein MRB53_003346 [Persea americana]
MKEKKLTVKGDVDPVVIVSKLRKRWHAEIVSVGPSKEPEKKKEEPKKGDEKDQMAELIKAYKAYNPNRAPPPPHYYVQSAEEDPIDEEVTMLFLRYRKFNLDRCSAQLAELAPAASAAYGTLLLGGGLFAYTRSGSKGSLFGGLSGAVLMGAVYVLLQVPETKYIGDALGFGSAFLFSSVFGIRLAATRKLMPAGLLLGLSVCALAVFISAYLQDREISNLSYTSFNKNSRPIFT